MPNPFFWSARCRTLRKNIDSLVGALRNSLYRLRGCDNALAAQDVRYAEVDHELLVVGGAAVAESGVLSRAYLTIVASLKIMLKTGVCQVSD